MPNNKKKNSTSISSNEKKTQISEKNISLKSIKTRHSHCNKKLTKKDYLSKLSFKKYLTNKCTDYVDIQFKFRKTRYIFKLIQNFPYERKNLIDQNIIF